MSTTTLEHDARTAHDTTLPDAARVDHARVDYASLAPGALRAQFGVEAYVRA
jgi:hypothetical protein